jgi:hypothetical protein
MSEQSGRALAAIQGRQAALATRHSAVADADRALAEALENAHAAMKESARRLDAIAAEIDDATPGPGENAVDTPMGLRELQRFLVVKQREIAAVVAHVHELDHAKAAVLQELRQQYTVPAQ